MRRVTRWHAGVVASLVLAGVGFVAASPALFLAAIVPTSFLLYAALTSVPEPSSSLVVSRTCTPERPLPGETVDVEVTVRNEGDRTIPDVRIVDGVPEAVSVLEGRTARGVALRAGESTTLSYTLQPRRGTYSFSPVRIRTRGLGASAVATAEIEADGDDAIDCRVPVEGVPVHRRTIPFVGAIATDSGGPGFEFHSTREYRHGDSVRRIDWRRYARTDELGTVRYREQEATKVVTLVDGRAVAAASAVDGRPDGVTLSVYAAVVATGAFSDAGHSVGVAGLGVSASIPGVYSGPPVYVEPSVGADVSARIARVCDAIAAGPGSMSGSLGTDPADTDAFEASAGAADDADSDAPVGATDGGATDGGAIDGRAAPESRRRSAIETAELRTLLPPDAQLFVCSPLLDDDIVAAVEKLRRHGYPVTVLSPDLTDADHVGARIESIRRAARLERLERLDVVVLDWNTDEPLSVPLERGFRAVVRK